MIVQGVTVLNIGSFATVTIRKTKFGFFASAAMEMLTRELLANQAKVMMAKPYLASREFLKRVIGKYL